MESPLIELRDLTVGYTTRGGQVATSRRLSASLRRGTLTCLIGANGVGKSTLLKTLSANLLPLEGEVLLEGRSLKDFTRGELSRRVGVVLTERIDVQGMTVREMVAMGRSPYTGFWGGLSAEDEAIVEQSIRLVGLDSLVSRQVFTLSDGERQKVMLAKALAQQTALILLDEPTAFLDFPSKVEAMLLLRRLAHEENRCILLSTHDVELAFQTADELWLLEGRDCSLVAGSPQALAANGALARCFESDSIRFDSRSLRFSVSPPAAEARLNV